MGYKCAIVTASDEMSEKRIVDIVDAVKKAAKLGNGDRICISSKFRNKDEKGQSLSIDPASLVSGRVTNFVIFFSESEAKLWANMYPIMNTPILVTENDVSVDEERIQVVSVANLTPHDVATKIIEIIM